MTTEAQDAPPGPHGPLPGVLIIEWPAPGPCIVDGITVSLSELDPLGSGAELPLPGVTRLTLHMTGAGPVTADVETLLGEDGEPLALRTVPGRKYPVVPSEMKYKDGRPVIAVRRYVVAEMRIRGAAH